MADMEEFNATPFTTSRPFVVPQAQKQSLEKEIAKTLEQLPVLKKVLKHLDVSISATDSVKKAFEISTTYEISKENALIVMNIVNQQLSSERSYIKARVERTIR